VLHSITMMMKQRTCVCLLLRLKTLLNRERFNCWIDSYLECNREFGTKFSQRASRIKECDELLAKLEKTVENQDIAARLDAVKIQIAELDAELKKPTVEYPENVSVSNFVDYMFIPTLVYEMEYPRTDRCDNCR
jgi:hypothetical protein